MADSSADLPTAVVEWAIGPIAGLADDLWISAPMVDAVERAMQSSGSRVTGKRLAALQAEGAATGMSLLEREYAALFEPLRLARRVALAYCTSPGDASGAFRIDEGDRRQTPSQALATALPMDADALIEGVAVCFVALSASMDLRFELVAAYDDLGFPPALVARRFAQLQVGGLDAPLRRARASMRQSLTLCARFALACAMRSATLRRATPPVVLEAPRQLAPRKASFNGSRQSWRQCNWTQQSQALWAAFQRGSQSVGLSSPALPLHPCARSRN